MKTVSVLLAILILVPAVAIACHCCSFVSQDENLSIERASCQSCCPNSSEISRDCGTFYAKHTLSVPQTSAATLPFIQLKTASFFQEEKGIDVFQPSPPLHHLSSLTVLRI